MSPAFVVVAMGALIMHSPVLAAEPASISLPVPPTGTLDPQVLWLTVPDIKGSYTIPYLQSAHDLDVRLQFDPHGPGEARVRLLHGSRRVAESRASVADPVLHLGSLSPGEYTLELSGLDASGAAVSKATWLHVGVGTVIGAIGDSITEGYQGRGFWRDNLDLHAADFPPEAVSQDGRNFPQYSPTTAWHRPDINCFQSWMTTLNDLLADKWRQPVFIANEGVGGITSGAYLKLMQTDAGWRKRMDLLRPQVWLLHLGVNDERAKVPAGDYAANMAAIVDLLEREYGAAPEHVLLCRPCYDYAEGAADILRSYITAQDELIARRGLRRGPDFFAAYAVDKPRWYGADPVHPNIEGMEYMARLWYAALAAALPEGIRP